MTLNRMRVGVERDRDGGVSEALGDDLGVDAGVQRESGVRAPEVVEPDPRSLAAAIARSHAVRRSAGAAAARRPS